MSYIIERGGHLHWQRFLSNPNRSGWPDDSDFSTFKKAHEFRNRGEAEKWVKDNKGEGQFTIHSTGQLNVKEL